jgi:MSHA pilin protein MshA
MTGDFDMDKAQKGFTLIELVVVITILGILAAFAFPRFAALEVEARAATINGLAGSVRAAASLAHSLELVGAAVTMEGNPITMVNGYPSAIDPLGIVDTLVDITGFTYAAGVGSGVFQKDGAPAGTCDVTYTESAGGGAPATVLVDTAAC